MGVIKYIILDKYRASLVFRLIDRVMDSSMNQLIFWYFEQKKLNKKKQKQKKTQQKQVAKTHFLSKVCCCCIFPSVTHVSNS